MPFAATPVAIATLVPSATWAGTGSTTIRPSDFCQDMPLTLADLGYVFGYTTTNPLLNWADSRIQCTPSGGTADGSPRRKWANLDPTMENEALMALLNSSPTSNNSSTPVLAQAVQTNQGNHYDRRHAQRALALCQGHRSRG